MSARGSRGGFLKGSERPEAGQPRRIYTQVPKSNPAVPDLLQPKAFAEHIPLRRFRAYILNLGFRVSGLGISTRRRGPNIIAFAIGHFNDRGSQYDSLCHRDSHVWKRPHSPK